MTSWKPSISCGRASTSPRVLSLVVAALARCAADGWSRIVVATGAADTGNLRFYQRLGFRFLSVERDAFTAATGYSVANVIDGIPLLDRVWLSQDLHRDRPVTQRR